MDGYVDQFMMDGLNQAIGEDDSTPAGPTAPHPSIIQPTDQSTQHLPLIICPFPTAAGWTSAETVAERIMGARVCATGGEAVCVCVWCEGVVSIRFDSDGWARDYVGGTCGIHHIHAIT